MNKPVKIVFTVSLILNVLFLGVAAGGVFYHSREPQRPWEKTRAELAPETRDIIKATFKGKKEIIMPLLKDAYKKKVAMKAILAAPEFNDEAYDALAAEFGAIHGQLIDNRFSAIKAIFSKLPQEERAKMAGHTVEKMLGKPPHDRKDRMRKPETRRFPHSGINSSERMDKRGAIEAQGGRPSFDARRSFENGANRPD